VRDPSFCGPELYALLRRFGVALVVADTGGRYPAVEEPTADFVYARLHGPRELYASGYSDALLDAWAARVRAWTEGGRDVYVYFDNDAGALRTLRRHGAGPPGRAQPRRMLKTLR